MWIRNVESTQIVKIVESGCGSLVGVRQQLSCRSWEMIIVGVVWGTGNTNPRIVEAVFAIVGVYVMGGFLLTLLLVKEKRAFKHFPRYYSCVVPHGSTASSVFCSNQCTRVCRFPVVLCICVSINMAQKRQSFDEYVQGTLYGVPSSL